MKNLLREMPEINMANFNDDDVADLNSWAFEAAEMIDAIERGGWDISPCGVCNLDVVCLPDGLPMCESCAKKEMESQ